MPEATIDLHDAHGKPLGLRVTLPAEHGPLIAIGNSYATKDHHLEGFWNPRFFLRGADGKYRDINPFWVCQPPCSVERIPTEEERPA